MQVDRDVLADQPVQHAPHVHHALVEDEDLGRENLPATERQELPGQGRGPVGGVEDLLDIGAQR